MSKFANYKVGDTVNLSGDIFKDDRTRGVLKSKVQFIDSDKIAIELNRGWSPKDNSMAVPNASKFEAGKKYYWVHDPAQISKAEDGEAPATAAAAPAQTIKTEVKESSKTENKIETKTTTSQKETNMSIVDQFKTDSVSAAYRVGGRKLTALAQKGLVTLMKAQGAKRKEINAMLTVAETDIGRTVIGQILGQAMGKIPGLKDDKRVQRLAEELRVESIANGMEFTLDAFVSNLLPSFLPGMSEILEALPEPTAATKVRVVAHDDKAAVQAEAEHEAEAEAHHSEKKRAKA